MLLKDKDRIRRYNERTKIFFLWRIVSTHKSFSKRDEWFGQFPLAFLPAQ